MSIIEYGPIKFNYIPGNEEIIFCVINNTYEFHSAVKYLDMQAHSFVNRICSSKCRLKILSLKHFLWMFITCRITRGEKIQSKSDFEFSSVKYPFTLHTKTNFLESLNTFYKILHFHYQVKLTFRVFHW